MASLTKNKTTGFISVSGEFCFNSTLSLFKQSQVIFSKLPAITLDFAKVTRADSSGIALILVWMKKSDEQKKKITLINVTKQMQTIIKVCGLEGVIKWKN